jgi:hypothetical protein
MRPYVHMYGACACLCFAEKIKTEKIKENEAQKINIYNNKNLIYL